MEKLTNNKSILDWVQNRIDLLQPDKVVWIDGSKEQIQALKDEAVSTGEFIKLNEEKLPDCYFHRTNPNDVARVEDRTFICTPTKEEAGPLNNWMDPDEAYKMCDDIIRGSYKGKTMYVIPYSMCKVGSPFAKYGLEVTDSIYVVCNMNIITRIGQRVLDAIGPDSTDWIKGTHASCNSDPEKRYINQWPQDNTISSVNSCYGGNVLQGKKCFALRIASNLARQEGWQAEHMLILGIEYPDGDTKYLTAAFPSACGKTNLAMLVPPKHYLDKGYKVWCVGDDISWIRKGPDGRLYAVNPEYGFFGVAPGTNMQSNPNALLSCRSGSIFTNVARNLDDNTFWWEGMPDAPENGEDWLGNPWNGKTSTEKGAYPNSRFTAPAKNCPCLSSEFENPTVSPFPRSSSAAAARNSLRWSIRPETGSTAYSSVPLWVPRPPLPHRVRKSASSVTTRWPCVRSSAMTAVPTSNTGWRSARTSTKTNSRRSSTSTGSARTTKVTSCGRASVTT